MRIASVAKPITLAAVRKLIRDGKLKSSTKVVGYLGVKAPTGKTMATGWSDITVAHLMNHQGGWDRDTAGDPMFKSKEISKSLGITGPAAPSNVITYMAGQPLQFTPGSKEVYSNFGYCLLGRVIEKASGKTYTDYVRSDITGPIGATSIDLGRSLPSARNSGEPVYLDSATTDNVMQPASTVKVRFPDGGFHLEAMDAHGGLTSSAPDLIRFLQAYWIDGQPRKAGVTGTWTFFGSLPGTTSMVHQRNDGVDLAVLFNERTGDASKDQAIKSMLNAAADSIKSWPK
jgi:N-acyl-D-amino-acid deacylase